MRKPIIAGNWKMNNTIEEGKNLLESIKAKELAEDVETLVCVPFTFLAEAKRILDGSKIKLGAQNMHYADSGAYTGEISPLMLKELNVEYVLIGHSERRQYFQEDNELINKKIKSALAHGVNPILCVGESLEEREAGREVEVVNKQIDEALEGIDDIENIVIAYEPVWAIGTGKTASADDANNMLRSIRENLEKTYNSEVSQKIRLQYGGSVKPNTIKELMDKEEVDGALVGGASLNADDFSKLVNY